MRNMNKYNYFFTLSILIIGSSACTKINDFPMGESHYQIKQVQILDPDAAERNDGIILSIDGNYGRKVMQSYRASSVSPKTANDINSVTSGSSN